MRNSRKGVVMLVVICIIFMLLILAAAAVMISTGHFGTSYHGIERTRAYYAATAAMQYAVWKCRTGQYNLINPAGGFPVTDTFPYNINGIGAGTIRIEVFGKNIIAGDSVPDDTHMVKIRVPY